MIAPRNPSQQGAALATALILLVIITILSLASLRNAATGVRLAQNAQLRVTAAEQAQSLVEEVLAVDANTPILEGTDYEACYDASSAAPFTCGSATAIQWPNARTRGDAYARVQRLAPEDVPIQRSMGSSATHYNAARYGITAGYNRAAEGLGAAEISEGVFRLKPSVPGLYVDGG